MQPKSFGKAVDALRSTDEKYDNGVAWIFAGSNYLALPWPIKSADKARIRFRKAQGIAPESPRNLYFSGLAAMEAGSTKQAAKLFQKSLDAPAVWPLECPQKSPYGTRMNSHEDNS